MRNESIAPPTGTLGSPPPAEASSRGSAHRAIGTPTDSEDRPAR
ncbi:hypothetical protein HMPREF9062_0024 [Actinomyces sp. oral taxon 448 str. F0400]|nr:hypothetical protein HMPREF9062_0024 [Actinomyces sp. oral taxon 448 str. F0400]